MKIDLNEIWHTKIAVTPAEVAERVDLLDSLGIDSTIDDEDVKYVDFWIPYRWIKSVEATGDGGFNILLRDGNIINSKENPFREER